MTSAEAILKELQGKVEQLSNQVLVLAADLQSAKLEASRLKGLCSTQFMGALRQEFQRKMEAINVDRNEYHSRSLVGNHCDKVVEHYIELTSVFSDYPDVQQKYNSLFSVYKPIHFLMKRRDWMTEPEICQLAEGCRQIGILYPKLLKRSIPSKVDDLIIAGK